MTKSIPDFLLRLRQVSTHDEAAVSAALAAAGLPVDLDAGWRGKLQYTVPMPPREDAEALLRKVRTACSRAVGKPSGGDKTYDVNCFQVTLRTASVNLVIDVEPQLGIAQLRDAARDWLAGMAWRDWLVRHHFAAPDAYPDSEGTWPRPDPSRARIKGHDRGQVTAYLYAGVRPPGARGASDDDRFDETLTYLAQELGEAADNGWWYRGSRSFSIGRSRTYTRNVYFNEAQPGRVKYGLLREVELPTTPDPDPVAATELIARLMELRGTPLPELVTRLTGEGVLAAEEPQHRVGSVVVRLAEGHPLVLRLVDDRLAGAVVQISTTAESKQADAARTARLGEPGADRRWRKDGMVIANQGTIGDRPFSRSLSMVGEDTAGITKAVGEWLLDGTPLPQLSVRDDWQGRCAGAAISAEVVPAVQPGMPVWRVDDRLVWLAGLQLHGAELAAAPAWAAGLPSGSSSQPWDEAGLTKLVEILSGWHEIGIEQAIAQLRNSGLVSQDPDSVSHSAWNDLSVLVRFANPAGRGISLREADGRVDHWVSTLVETPDRQVVDEVWAALLAGLSTATGQQVDDQTIRQFPLGGFTLGNNYPGQLPNGSYRLTLTGYGRRR